MKYEIVNGDIISEIIITDEDTEQSWLRYAEKDTIPRLTVEELNTVLDACINLITFPFDIDMRLHYAKIIVKYVLNDAQHFISEIISNNNVVNIELVSAIRRRVQRVYELKSTIDNSRKKYNEKIDDVD